MKKTLNLKVFSINSSCCIVSSIIHAVLLNLCFISFVESTPKARVYPSFTVKGSFTATNVGQLPVEVASMNINNYECEGYGFRILNCEPFTLMPNSSKKIDIT